MLCKLRIKFLTDAVIYSHQKRALSTRKHDDSAAAVDADNEDDAIDDTAERKSCISEVCCFSLRFFLHSRPIEDIVTFTIIRPNEVCIECK